MIGNRRTGDAAILISWLTVCSMSLGSSCTEAVQFEKTYGGSDDDWGFSAMQTDDGGYVIAGWTRSFGAGERDVLVVKTDSLGDTRWLRTYGGSGGEWADCVQQTSDGGYVAVGLSSSFGSGDSDVYLLKLDSLGELLWMQTYGGDSNDGGKYVVETADGGYVIAGWTGSFCPRGDVYLVKTDSEGNPLWSRTHGGPGTQKAFCVQQTADGGYIVAGWVLPTALVDYEAYLLKVDSLGDSLWARTYGGARMDAGHSVRETSDGGYVVAGFTYSFGYGNADMWLIRTDSLGAVLWTRTYGKHGEDLAWSIDVAVDGGFLIGGETYEDLYVVRTNSWGDTLWTRKYGGHKYERANSIEETSDGGCIAAGFTNSFGEGGYDFYLIKAESVVDTTCRPTEPPQVRSQGYWRRQCKDDGHEDICSYVDSVMVLADLFDAFDCDSVCVLMNVDPPENDMCRKARRNFMGLLLNIASGKLAVCNCLEDGREVGDAVSEIDSLLSGNPDFHTCEYAKTIADNINNGIGVVPCDTLREQAPPRAVRPPFPSVAPNPFAKSTIIEYEVKVPGRVRLEIYDKAGRLIRTLTDAHQRAGTHIVRWNGLNERGQRVPTGVYFSRLQVGANVSSTKLVLLN